VRHAVDCDATGRPGRAGPAPRRGPTRTLRHRRVPGPSAPGTRRVVEARQFCHRRLQPSGQAVASGPLTQPHQPRMGTSPTPAPVTDRGRSAR
jgi:hypothetical protein